MSRDLRLLALVGIIIFSAASLPTHAAPAKPAKPAATPAGPRVVSTQPATGSKTVDPGLTELKITFSEPMQPGEFYLGPIAGRDLPEWGEPVSFSEDGRVLTVPITLKPNHKYGIAVNAPGHLRFRSVTGKVARPYQLFFNTAATAGPAAAAAPGATAAPTAPAAAGFQLVAPTAGAEVRDKVTLAVPAEAVPEGSFVTFHVDGIFMLGVAPERRTGLLRFVWDTKQPLPGSGKVEDRLVKDGEHTLRAELHQGGTETKPTQVAEVKVTLKNTIDTPEAAEGFQLRYQFATGQELAYQHEFENSVKRGGGPVVRHRGQIRTEMLMEEKLREGPFAMWGRFDEARLDDVKLTGRDLSARWGLPKSVRFELDPQGMLRIVTKRGRPLVEILSQ